MPPDPMRRGQRKLHVWDRSFETAVYAHTYIQIENGWMVEIEIQIGLLCEFFNKKCWL